MSIQCTIVPVTPYQQNCSIIKCESTGKAAIVDPGGDVERILEAVEKMQQDGLWNIRKLEAFNYMDALNRPGFALNPGLDQ